MNRIFKGSFALLVLILSVSCVSVQAVKRGGDIKADASYVALKFTDKADLLSVGKRIVYIVLQQKDTGRQFYIPFGAGDELRLVSLPSGSYAIADFAYLGGTGVASVDPFRLPGVASVKPEFANTILIAAGYPDEYRMEFTLDSGEVLFLGYFSSEAKIDFAEHATTVNRSAGSNIQAQILMSDAYPSMPSLMKVVALTE